MLYASVRSKPYAVQAYRIDAATGALQWMGASPLPDSMVNLDIDRSGRWLLAASYGGNTLSVHAIGSDGRIAAEPTRFFPSGGNKPHSLHIDRDNRFVYVPHLGSDEIRRYRFDAATGAFAMDQVVSQPVKKGTGPRHFVHSGDGRFLYLLGEMAGTVTVYRRDAESGALTEVQTLASQPPDSPLVPGQPRAPAGSPDAVAFDESKAIWSADVQMTPDGRFLYTSERTQSQLTRFGVDRETGRLKWLGLTPTEKQPRGFAIDPTGRFLVASGEKSETVSLYAIDAASGDLALRQQVPGGKGANWVQIVRTP
jgi:6-phosphogluconolactonase